MKESGNRHEVRSQVGFKEFLIRTGVVGTYLTGAYLGISKGLDMVIGDQRNNSSTEYNLIVPYTQAHIELSPPNSHALNPSLQPNEPVNPVASPTETPPPDKAALPYYKMINASANKHNVPVKILYHLLRQESGFNPNVVSPKDARGIAQFLKSTAQGMGIDPFNPEQAIDAAGIYLENSYKKYGRWDVTLATYNAGTGNVEDYMNGTNINGNNPNHEKTGGLPDFPETKNYIKNILADD